MLLRIVELLRKVGGCIRTIWLMIGLTLLLILLFEGTLRVAYHFRDRYRCAEVQRELMATSSAMADPDGSWAPTCLEESSRLKSIWSRYIHYRSQPFAGQTLNIDETGRRKTWNATQSGL